MGILAAPLIYIAFIKERKGQEEGGMTNTYSLSQEKKTTMIMEKKNKIITKYTYQPDLSRRIDFKFKH